jgi:hypothetical protein
MFFLSLFSLSVFSFPDPASLETPFDSDPTDSRDLLPFVTDRTPSRSVGPSTDQEWTDDEEEEQQRKLMFLVATVLIMVILALASLYVYCQRRIEAEQNTEYTRPIIADDVYEFSQLENQ